MVTLMSGILSLVREAVQIFAPNKMAEKKLFWMCVRIAFVISAIALWCVEHSANLELHSEINTHSRPDLQVVVAALQIANHTVGETVVMAQMGVLNKGADSAITHMAAHFKSPTFDQAVPIVYLPPEEEAKAFPTETQTEDKEVGSMRTAGTITRGSLVPGKVFVIIPQDHTQELKSVTTGVLTLTVWDYLGNESSGSLHEGGNNVMASGLPFHTTPETINVPGK